jgi:hypothetical protein
MRTILASQICKIIESGVTVSISYNNCYTSTQYLKVYEFLEWFNDYSKNHGFTEFYIETFRKNYFVVKNNIFANIKTNKSN